MKSNSEIMFDDLALIPEAQTEAESSRLWYSCYELIHTALDKMSENEREIVLLHGYFGFSFYEVAAMQHLNGPVTARRCYMRYIKKLKGMILKDFKRMRIKGPERHFDRLSNQ